MHNARLAPHARAPVLLLLLMSLLAGLSCSDKTQSSGDNADAGLTTLASAERETVYREHLVSRVKEMKLDSLQVQVSLHRYVSVAELRQLIDPAFTSVYRVIVFLPHVQGGTHSSVDLPQVTTPTQVASILSNALLEQANSHDAGLLGDLMTQGLSEDQALAEVRKVSPRAAAMGTEIRSAAASIDSEVMVSGFRATGSPQAILQWWERNSTTIRFVQPLRSELDDVQRTWEPGAEF